ncbi:unnamed protein product [Rangifer tarandus platyrhynchus]
MSPVQVVFPDRGLGPLEAHKIVTKAAPPACGELTVMTSGWCRRVGWRPREKSRVEPKRRVDRTALEQRYRPVTRDRKKDLQELRWFGPAWLQPEAEQAPRKLEKEAGNPLLICASRAMADRQLAETTSPLDR